MSRTNGAGPAPAVTGGEAQELVGLPGDDQAFSPSRNEQQRPERRHQLESEQAIQRAVFQHIRVRGAKGLFAFHPANGGWRTPTEGAIFKGLGVVPGVPDVVAIKDGKVFALELKSANGHVSPAQREAHDNLRRAGAIVGVSFGLDQAIAALEGWDLLRGKVRS